MLNLRKIESTFCNFCCCRPALSNAGAAADSSIEGDLEGDTGGWSCRVISQTAAATGSPRVGSATSGPKSTWMFTENAQLDAWRRRCELSICEASGAADDSSICESSRDPLAEVAGLCRGCQVYAREKWMDDFVKQKLGGGC